MLLPHDRADSWWKAAVGLGLIGILVAWLAQPVSGGDTGPLMSGTETLGRCLAELDLFLCDQATPIGPWPILQYVPDLIGDAAGLSDETRILVLATLSSVGVGAAAWAGWVVFHRIACPEWRWGFLLVVMSGPAVAYGNTTWGEMLAGGLLTLLVAAAVIPSHPVLFGLAAFGAGLTKESGYPFVVALGLIGLLLARSRTGNAIRRHVLFGAAGVVLAFSVGAAFNMLRFGTPKNVYYLDPTLRTPGVDRFFEFTTGLFVSPNGGILFFWPLASLIVALLVVIPVVRALRGVTEWGDAWIALALIAIVSGLVAGLAAWWSPFGWWAWGPRLSLPWVFPILLLALVAFGPTLTPAVARALASTPRFVTVSALLVVAALPHVGLVWHPEIVGDFFYFHKTAVCPGGSGPGYYDCLHEQMWTRHPIWLDALSGLRKPGGLGTAVAVSLVVVGCLVLFRRDAERSVGEQARLPGRSVPYRPQA